MATLQTTLAGIDFENPFILASAPPSARIESIDKAFSLGCGKCAKICEDIEYKSLTLQNGHIILDNSKCIGCSLCSHVCPKSAIKMI